MPSKSKHYVPHTDADGEVTLVYTFFEEEYRKGIVAPKKIKAAGTDNVLVKQLNNLGPTLHNWLLDMLKKCFTENKVPRLLRQSMFNYIYYIYYRLLLSRDVNEDYWSSVFRPDALPDVNTKIVDTVNVQRHTKTIHSEITSMSHVYAQ